jgi:hypothetical protein
MRRAVLACAITVGLAIGTVLPTSAIGLAQVTLSCNDGTSVTLVVDTDTLTSLTASVQAMLDYPAGLTCTLVQSPLPLALGAIALASPGSNPFIVAGGRWQVPCGLLLPGGIGVAGAGVVARVPGASYSLIGPAAFSSAAEPDDLVWVNIAVNVHQKDGGTGTFFGTLNETIPQQQTATCGLISESHFTSKATCLMITQVDQPPIPPVAFVTSQVTEVSGAPFPPPIDQSGSVNVEDDVHFGFQDNGQPPGQNPTDMTPSTDTLSGPPAVLTVDRDPLCQPGPYPTFHLGEASGLKQNGNISIHQ